LPLSSERDILSGIGALPAFHTDICPMEEGASCLASVAGASRMLQRSCLDPAIKNDGADPSVCIQLLAEVPDVVSPQRPRN